MACDEDLADRIRALLADETGVSERSRFGGRAFLLHGNLAIAASGQGGVLVRAGADQADRLASRSNAEVAVMRGWPMTGWLRVRPDDLRTKRQLARRVTIGADVARSLPRKAGDKRAKR